MKPKKELIRVVRNDSGEIFIDKTGKKNGRGAYICPAVICLERAMKTRSLERSFGCAIPAEIYGQLKTELEQDIHE